MTMEGAARTAAGLDELEGGEGFLLAEPTGLEPATSGVTVRCANQLHYGSVPCETPGS